jgi:epoxyqueuosine reductase
VPGVRREQGRLRKDIGLNPGLVPGRAVELARQAGFHRAAIVDPRLLPEWADRLRSRPGGPDQGHLAGMEWRWVTEPSTWSGASTILVCCLSCLRVEPDEPSEPGEPYALVAPFARANYYRTAITLLRRVAVRLEEESGIPRSSIRLFSNSRLPEKPLLAATGMAAYGRNGCAIVPGLGSMFVIAGAVIPVPTPAAERLPVLPADPCGACRRCRAACPAGAIEQPFVVRHDLCLQGKAGRGEVFDEETSAAWGTRLYGCQECQSVCPHNRGLTERAPASTGEIGPGVALRAFLAEDEAERKQRFRGTSLGMSWISADALLRNALVAAGNRGDGTLCTLVERHITGGPEHVRSAARRAREMLRPVTPCG